MEKYYKENSRLAFFIAFVLFLLWNRHESYWSNNCYWSEFIDKNIVLKKFPSFFHTNVKMLTNAFVSLLSSELGENRINHSEYQLLRFHMLDYSLFTPPSFHYVKYNQLMYTFDLELSCLVVSCCFFSQITLFLFEYIKILEYTQKTLN